MKESEIILTPVPQNDGVIKNRPALILCEFPGFHDFLVCGIRTQLQHYIQNFDEMILLSDPDFQKTGLQSSSLIRLGFLAVIPRKRIMGVIGSISISLHNKLLTRLSNYLIQKQTKL